jgi:chaperone modulatory protein CbpM
MNPKDILEGPVLDDSVEMTLAELARACAADAEWLLSLVNEGILNPRGRAESEWRFTAVSIWRVRQVRRLQADLGVNLAGAALALELLAELDTARRRLASLEAYFSNHPGERAD